MTQGIHHVAIWVSDLERIRAFYETYFGAKAGERYDSRHRPFASYFLSFPGGGRLELMQSPEVAEHGAHPHLGWAHIAISVGSHDQVDALTSQLRHDGHSILSPPRTTGDGCYESVAADPEGNPVEITV
jgi:lactoylglutathione lyase